MISRRAFVRALTGGLVAAPLAAEAQPKRTTPRIAVLDVGSSSASSARTEWFRKSMRELEYVEGQNIENTWRYAGGMYARLSNLASELIGLTPDVLVSPDEWGVRALLKANPDIPIVVAGADAWSSFITPENLAKPTRNITGVISARSNLGGKRMELLRETMPAVSRVASFRDSTVFNYPEGRLSTSQSERWGLTFIGIVVSGPDDFEDAFAAAVGKRVGALSLPRIPMFYTHRRRLAELAVRNRLGWIAAERELPHAGSRNVPCLHLTFARVICVWAGSTASTCHFSTTELA